MKKKLLPPLAALGLAISLLFAAGGSPAHAATTGKTKAQVALARQEAMNEKAVKQLGLKAAVNAPDTLGPGWVTAFMTASSGGGCATYDQFQRLSPIISYTCNNEDYWEVRVVGASNPDDYCYGAEIEWVDPSGTYALGYSGGLFKLETPDANTTYLFTDGCENSGGYQYMAMAASNADVFAEPNGWGKDLKTPISPTDAGWDDCTNNSSYCDNPYSVALK
jgi:hypothetical protein